MHRKFIAAVVSAAILITGFTAGPSRAGEEDVARALTALLGIAIVGAVINEARKDKAPVVTRQYSPVQTLRPRPLPHDVRRFEEERHHGYHRGDRHMRLPGDCLRSVETRQGRLRLFQENCLQRNAVNTRRLPDACAVKLRGPGPIKHGFEARCLRNRGYTLAVR